MMEFNVERCSLTPGIASVASSVDRTEVPFIAAMLAGRPLLSSSATALTFAGRPRVSGRTDACIARHVGSVVQIVGLQLVVRVFGYSYDRD